MANDLAGLAELFAAELATQFERIAGHRTFSLLDQLQAGLELLVPEQVLLVSLGGVADLVAGLADEASSPWLPLLVSATLNPLTLPSSIMLSSLMLLQLSLCSKFLPALRTNKVMFSIAIFVTMLGHRVNDYSHLGTSQAVFFFVD